ncbi:MAG: mechanosensitive ion channel [Eubacteriaceae bacterium]|nr:mechanosensitive ion channel [Eubacteriaceae bacterium]
MKKDHSRSKWYFPIILYCVTAVFIMGIFLGFIEHKYSLSLMESNMNGVLDSLQSSLIEKESHRIIIRNNYDELNASKVRTAIFGIRNDKAFKNDSSSLRFITFKMKVSRVDIIDREGKVILASDGAAPDYSDPKFDGLRAVYDAYSFYAPFETEYAGSSYRYYTEKLSADTQIVVAAPTLADAGIASSLDSLLDVLPLTAVDMGGFVGAVSGSDSTIIYWPEEQIAGQKCTDCGLTLDKLIDGRIHRISIGSESYYIKGALYSPMEVYLVAAIPHKTILGSTYNTVGGLLLGFVFILIICFVYVISNIEETLRLSFDNKDTRRMYQHDSLRAKVTISWILSAAAFLAMAFYVQTIFALNRQMVSTRNLAEKAVVALNEAYQTREAKIAGFNQEYLEKAQAAAELLSRNPDLQNSGDIALLSEAMGVEYIMLFDNEGRETVSDSTYINFELSSDPGDQSYAFRRLLNGVPYYIQDVQPDELTGKNRQYIGVIMQNTEGKTDGMLVMCIDPTLLYSTLIDTDLDNVLSSVTAGTAGFVYMVNKEDFTFAWLPYEQYIGTDSRSMGQDESCLKDGMFYNSTFRGTKYFSFCEDVGRGWLVIAESKPVLMRNRAAFALQAFILAAALLVILDTMLLLHPDPIYQEAVAENDFSRIAVTVFTGGGVEKKTREVRTRWMIGEIPWASRSADEKTTIVISWILYAVALFITVLYMARDIIPGESDIIGSIASLNWKFGLNVFSLTASMMAICVAVTLVNNISRIISLAARAVNPRTETVLRLIRSTIEYGSVIGMVFVCLTLLGVNTTALWASAGILSLVIGLGSKDLVSDILSGLFLIFEGAFQVGDIVEVGGYRGSVEDIGVRTTKIMDSEHNIKVLSNGALVSGVVNLTSRLSVFRLVLGIPLDSDLKKAERILTESLPNVGEFIPEISEGPSYIGLEKIEEDQIKLVIKASCKENDRSQAMRDLRHILKEIMDKNGIKVVSITG